MVILLRYNVSNQKYFRETDSCTRLSNLLLLPAEDNSESDPATATTQFVWDDQSIRNVNLVLDICCLFVPAGNDATPINQLALYKAGVLMNVLRLAFGGSTTVSIRSSALITAADVVRSNNELQNNLASIDVPYVDLSIAVNVQKTPELLPLTSALLNWTLLSSSVHTFDLRLASARCFVASFANNYPAKLDFMNDQISSYKSINGLLSNGDGEAHPEPSKSFSGANLISALVDYDADARLNPYKIWFAAALLSHIFQGSPEIQDLVRDVSMGVEENGEDVVSVIQSMSGTLVSVLNYQDPRIAIAYLMLLSVWLYDDIKAVDNFLEESSTVQSLVYFLTHTTPSHHPLVIGLAAVLLGIVYDFSSPGSPISRADLHRLLIGTIGRDQYALRVQKLRENPMFKEFDEKSQLFNAVRDETGLPEVFLDSVYVDLVRENFGRIQKAFDKDPEMEPNSRVSLEMYEGLQQLHTAAKSELAELKKASHELEIKQNSEIKNLADKLENTEKLLSETQLKLQSVREENVHVSEKLDSLEIQHSNLNKEYVTLKESHQRESGEAKRLAKVVEDLTLKEKQSSALLTTYKKDKEKAESGINKMNKELFSLTRDLTEANKQIKSLNKKVEELTSRNNKFQASELTLSQQLQQVSKTKDELEFKSKALRSEYDQLKVEKDNLLLSQKQVSEELETYRSNLYESETLKATVIQKLQSAARQIEDYKGLKDQHLKRIEELTAENSSIKTKLVESQSSKQEEIDKLKSELENSSIKHSEILLLTKSSLEKDLEDLKKAHSSEIQLVSDQHTDSSAIIENLNGKIHNMENEYQSEIDKLAAATNKMSVEKKELEAQLESQSSKLKSELEATAKDVTDTKESLAKITEESRSLLDRVNSLSKENSDYKEKITKLEISQQASSSDLALSVKTLEQENQDLHEKINNSQVTSEQYLLVKAQLKDGADKLIQQEERIKELNAKIGQSKEASNDYDGTIRELEDGSVKLKEQVDSLSREKAKLTEQLSKQQDEFTALVEQNKSELEMKLAEKDSSIQSAIKRAVDSSKNLATCQEELKEKKELLDRIQNESDEKFKKVAEESRLFQQQKEQVELSKSSDESQIKSLKLEIEKLKKGSVSKSDYDDLMLVLQDLDEKSTKYKTRLKKLHQEVSEDEEEEEEEEEGEEDEGSEEEEGEEDEGSEEEDNYHDEGVD